MGKAGKWLKNFLSGKKLEKEHSQIANQISTISSENSTTPISTPKEKKRWSFRRPSPTKDVNPPESNVAVPANPPATTSFDMEKEQEKHAMAVAAATAAAVAAAQAVIRLTAATNGKGSAIEEAAAIKIQSVFRSYLVYTQKLKMNPEIDDPQIESLKQLFVVIEISGKEGSVCFERIGEITSDGERPFSETESHRNSAVYASFSDGAGQSSNTED